MNATKIIGVTDEVCTCDCCGRTDLKRTIVLDLGEGNIVHFGSLCAARSMGRTGKGQQHKVENEAASAQFLADREKMIAAKVAARRAELLAMSRAEYADWKAAQR